LFEITFCDLKIRDFFGGELHDEIIWEAAGIAFDLLIEAPHFDPVEFGKVGVEHDTNASNQHDL